MLAKKLEDSRRIEELAPYETLKRIGLANSHVLCDIGAGTGVFTIPAASITKNKVYALDIKEEMLSIIKEKARKEQIDNIECIKVDEDRLPLGDGSVDIVLLVTVLHEIPSHNDFLKEIKRILVTGGRVGLIEFHKEETPMGPPVAYRVSKEEADHAFESLGFILCDKFDLGDNFYCRVYETGS